jgi:hypothetical protein
MRLKINERDIQDMSLTGGCIELLGKRSIIEFIDNELTKKIGVRLDRVYKENGQLRENIVALEQEIIKMREFTETFRKELYELREICQVINHVSERFDSLEEISSKVAEFNEDMILFKLKLLREEEKENDKQKTNEP